MALACKNRCPVHTQLYSLAYERLLHQAGATSSWLENCLTERPGDAGYILQVTQAPR